jgi:hypothetical protein
MPAQNELTLDVRTSVDEFQRSLGYVDSGQVCRQTGIYRSDCGCGLRLAVLRGTLLPPCEDCCLPVTWKLSPDPCEVLETNPELY